MAITVQQAVEVWAQRWCALRAWGRPLEEARILVRKAKARDRIAGCAYVEQRRVEVYFTDDMPDNLRIVLHELAHLATPAQDNHSQRWANYYAAAVREVTKIGIVADPQPAGRYRDGYTGNGAWRDIDNAAGDAIEHWWKRSGEARLFKMASTKIATR